MRNKFKAFIVGMSLTYLAIFAASTYYAVYKDKGEWCYKRALDQYKYSTRLLTCKIAQEIKIELDIDKQNVIRDN